ncbi:MAG: DUF2332 family protein [Pseudomonadota bacterium]
MNELRRELIKQGEICTNMGSPFMGRLLGLLAQRLTATGEVERRLFDWPGDISPSSASVPLRLAGALHAQVLQDQTGALAQCYPPHEVSDTALWDALAQTLSTRQADLLRWLDSPPQTNEVRRSGVLIAVSSYLAQRYDRPLILSEIGASAGLNLMFDRFGLKIGDAYFGARNPALTLEPDWHGELPATDAFVVSDRRGTDLNPLNPRHAPDQMRLRAYLWPDQPHRRALTDAAIASFDASVDAQSAETWLPSRLDPAPNGLHMIYHTVAWQYFPKALQAKCREQIEAAGLRATAQRPLAWFGMEADTKPGAKGAALNLRLWPGDLHISLGRADFHGRWVEWMVGT